MSEFLTAIANNALLDNLLHIASVIWIVKSVKFRDQVKHILQITESDLYHICKFNVDVRSNSLIELKEFMRNKNIKEME